MEASKITFKQYYKLNYGINIKDDYQPMLVSQDRNSSAVVYLIPELCRMTGLDRKIRNDTKLMNKIARYTRLEPQTRIEHIRQLSQKIQKRSKDIWGIEIEE